MAKSKVKKIITSIVAISAVAGAIFGGYKILESAGIFGNNNNNIQTLSTVTNISFDEERNIFSWDTVDNADKYVVSINGQQSDVTENYIFHIPTTQTTEVKVKAVDTTGEYLDSKWSNTYTYTQELTDTFNYAKVYNYVNNMLEGTQVEKIVSMYVKDGDVITNAVMNDGELYVFESDYETDVTSIEDAIQHTDLKIHSILGHYEIANYDSASYLLQSNSLCGELEERRQEGYNISIVSSQALKEDANGEVFYIYATYKLDNGSDTKYVQSKIKCIITNPSQTEKTNYTTKLVNEDNRKLRELSYVELTGDAVKVAEMMDNMNMSISSANLGSESMEY